MIENLFNGGSMPVLERVVQFTSRRHKLIAHNIANISTPYHAQRDVDPKAFQSQLADAVEERRSRTGGPNGALPVSDSREVEFGEGRVHLNPTIETDNLVFHDRNNRSLEHLMKDLATNTGAHNTAMQLLRSEFNIIETAIRERP